MRNARRLRTAVGAILAVLSALVPAGAAPQARPGSRELAALVPRLADWALTESPRSYFPEDLFEYIDGAAESYLSYDFRELLVVDLKKNAAEATLTVEIYDMALPVNAFGIFASERYPDNKTVAVGELGYIEGEALNFLAGRFYVKLLAFGLGEGAEPALTGIAAKVAGAVKPGPGELPAPVLAFPKAGLVTRSERYIKRNFMGYEFLRDGYVATYISGGREIEGFFIAGASEQDAGGMMAKLADVLAADGQAVEKIPLGRHVRNRYGQHLFIGQVGSFLCGAMRVPDGLEDPGQVLFQALREAASKLAGGK